MSGHSKWHNIKRKKEVTDKKKGVLFTSLSRDIARAARQGTDPAANSTLREAIERAKKANVPQANIDRLLERSAHKALEDIMYEGVSPSGISLLISTETDNPRRTVAELRTLLKNHGGRLADPGSVKWKFSPTAQVRCTIPPAKQEALELALIDAGSQDIRPAGNAILVTADLRCLAALEEAIGSLNGSIEHSTVAYLPQHTVPLTAEQQTAAEQLIESLLAHSDVRAVWDDARRSVDHCKRVL